MNEEINCGTFMEDKLYRKGIFQVWLQANTWMNLTNNFEHKKQLFNLCKIKLFFRVAWTGCKSIKKSEEMIFVEFMIEMTSQCEENCAQERICEVS